MFVRGSMWGAVTIFVVGRIVGSVWYKIAVNPSSDEYVSTYTPPFGAGVLKLRAFDPIHVCSPN